MLVTVSACSDLDQRKKQGGPARLRSVNIKPPTTIKAFFPLPPFFCWLFLGFPLFSLPYLSLSLSLSLQTLNPTNRQSENQKFFPCRELPVGAKGEGPDRQPPAGKFVFCFPKKWHLNPGFLVSLLRRAKKRKEEERRGKKKNRRRTIIRKSTRKNWFFQRKHLQKR